MDPTLLAAAWFALAIPVVLGARAARHARHDRRLPGPRPGTPQPVAVPAQHHRPRP